MDINAPRLATGLPGYVTGVTYFHGTVSLVSVPMQGTFVRDWQYFLTVTRKVDGASPQFATAMANGLVCPKVSIGTVSWQVVTLHNAWIACITKGGHRNPRYPGSRIVDPGYEAIMWQATKPILVDGIVAYASFDWNVLNHAFRPKGMPS